MRAAGRIAHQETPSARLGSILIAHERLQSCLHLAGTTVKTRHQQAHCRRAPHSAAVTPPTRHRQNNAVSITGRSRPRSAASASTSSSRSSAAAPAGSRRRWHLWRCPFTSATSRGYHYRIDSPWAIILVQYQQHCGFWRCGAAGARKDGGQSIYVLLGVQLIAVTCLLIAVPGSRFVQRLLLSFSRSFWAGRAGTARNLCACLTSSRCLKTNLWARS